MKAQTTPRIINRLWLKSKELGQKRFCQFIPASQLHVTTKTLERQLRTIWNIFFEENVKASNGSFFT